MSSLLIERIEEVQQTIRAAILSSFPGIRQRYDIEDLVQDSLLQLLRREHKYDPSKGSFKTFAAAVARNVVLDRIQRDRRKCRRPEGGTVSLDEVIWSSSHTQGRNILRIDRIPAPGDMVEQYIFSAYWAAAMRALDALEDKRMKRVIYERFLRGRKKTLAELAACMGVSRECVRQIEQKALRRMREAMERERYGL